MRRPRKSTLWGLSGLIAVFIGALMARHADELAVDGE
jgi:hypothetical protein